MKRLFLLLMFVFVVFPFSCAWATCENMVFYHTDSGELELPCVNVGSSSCYKAKLKLNPYALGENKIEFDLVDLEQTTQPLPTSEDSILTPQFDSNTFLLKIPYVVIDSTFDVYDVVLKLQVIPAEEGDDIFFTINSIKSTIMPNVCIEEGTVTSCKFIDPEDGLLFCLEWTGSAQFTETMLQQCNGIKSQDSCPAGAISSCSTPFPEDNLMTAYGYQPSANIGIYCMQGGS